MYLKKTNLLSNSKINLLWLLLFSIAFFALLIGFTTTTQAAVPPPQGPYLEVNTSQNWINLRNFPANTQVTISINNSEKVNEIVQTDPAGNVYGFQIWPYGQQIAFGDQIVATYSGGSVSMTVDTITVDSFDVENDRVWGTVTEPQNNNKPNYWQVTLFPDENSGNELGNRDGSPAQPNGTYFANFAIGDPIIDIQPFNVAWIRSYDVNLNQTIFVTSSPKLEVDVTNNNVNGRYFNTAAVDIEVKDAQNNVKINKTGIPTQKGNFNTDFWDFDEEKRLNFGDTIIVQYGNNNVQFTVPFITNIVVDSNARTVSGTVNPQTSGDVSVNRRYSGEMLSYRPYNADDQGNFTTNFSVPTGQDWQGVVNEFDHTQDIRIDNRTSEGHSVVVHAGTPTIKANFSHNWIEAQYLPINADVTVKINDSDNLQLSRNSGVGGRISLNGNDFGQGYRVSPDDNIKVFQGSNLIAEMDVSRITGVVNFGNDTVGGEVKHDLGLNNPSDSTVQVEVSDNGPWEQRNRSIDLNNSSNYLADFKVPVGNKLDIRPIHEIQVTETDNTNGNQTIMWTGASKIRAHLSENWIEAQNLPAEENYTVRINDDPNLQFSERSGKDGRVWLDGNDFGSKNYRVSPSDNIKILQGLNLVTQMDVSGITADVDADGDTVGGNVFHSGGPAPDSLLRVEINSGGLSWAQKHRDAPLFNASAYGVNFGLDNDEYDPGNITPRDDLEITETDNRNGNQTILRAGSPRLKANISHSWIQGEYFPKGRQNLTLEVRDNEDNPLVTENNLKTDSNGFFQFNWWEANQRQLQAGDKISIFDGQSLLKSMEVTNLSIEAYYGANRIRGNAWLGTEVSVRIDDNESVSVRAGQDGRYEVDPSPLILTQRNEIWAENYDNQANATIVVKSRLMLQTNVTSQWFQAQGLTPGNYEVEVWSGSQMKAKVNNITADSNGNLRLDANRVRETLQQWDFYYLNDDNIKVLSGQNVVASMDVAQPLTVNVDIDTDTVTGVAPVGNTLWLDVNPIGGGPQVFHYEYGEVPLSGNYVYTFNGDVNAGHEVYATVEDGDGNQTTVSGASPRFEIWDYSATNIAGRYFTPGSRVEIWFGNKPVGTQIGQVKEVDISGRLNSWEENLPDSVIQPGQTINVYLEGNNSPLASWTVPIPELTASFNPGNDTINGTAPNGEVHIQLAPWWFDEQNNGPSMDVPVVDGAYTVNLAPYDLKRDDWGQFSYTDNDGNKININSSAAKLSADMDSNSISGSDFDNNHQDYNLSVTDSSGQPKGSTIQVDTNQYGDFQNVVVPGVQLAPGDQIKIEDNGNPVVSMTVAPLNGSVIDYVAEKINGTTELNTSVEAIINNGANNPYLNETEAYAWSQPQDVNGSGYFSIGLLSGEDKPYDIGNNQGSAWIRVNNDGNATIYKQPVNDVNPPETKIDSGPTGTISTNSATFTFSATDGSSDKGLEFSYTLDGINWSPYSATTTANFNGLAPGSYTFQVKARDFRGNEDLTPASQPFTYTPPPPPPPAPAPPAPAPVVTPTPSAPSGVSPAPSAGPPAPAKAPQKKKKKVITPFHKKKCKNKKFHASHCQGKKKNKIFHKKKCSKIV